MVGPDHDDQAQSPGKREGANASLVRRLLTAAVLAPLVIFLVVKLPPLATVVLVGLGLVLCLLEFECLQGSNPGKRMATVILGIGYAAVSYGLARTDIAVVGLLGACLTAALFGSREEMQLRVARSQHTLFGVLYVSLLLYLCRLRDLPGEGSEWVLLALSVTWVGDAFAYGAGRLFGRHKLSPALSPAKTWEGAVGGVVGSLFAAVLAKAWYFPSLGWEDVVCIAIPAALLGQIGDLAESMLKRVYSVKDTSHILPGHGGMLDRVDGLLFVLPYVYWYAQP